MNDTRIHTRINDGLLGPLERPTLKWLAAHSPKWMNPDIYTTIGIAGSAIAFIGYLLSRYHPVYLWMATLGFIVNWIGDSMDGTLARYRQGDPSAPRLPLAAIWPRDIGRGTPPVAC